MNNEEKIIEREKRIGMRIHSVHAVVTCHELRAICAVIAAARNVNLGLFDQDVYGNLENALEAFDKLVIE